MLLIDYSLLMCVPHQGNKAIQSGKFPNLKVAIASFNAMYNPIDINLDVDGYFKKANTTFVVAEQYN